MKKTLQCDIPLLAPIGKVMVPIKITYDDKEVIIDPKSEITLLYSIPLYNKVISDLGSIITSLSS